MRGLPAVRTPKCSPRIAPLLLGMRVLHCCSIDVMPELSRFYGIIIRMFFEASERHHMPHFHAYYQEHVAVFSMSPVALIIGFLPQRQQRLVEAWAELHTAELLADWQLLEQGRKPAPIPPLQ